MKALNTPFAKGLGYVIFWILVSLFFGSCRKDPIPHRNLHSLIFERGNDSTYLFADFHEDSIKKPDTRMKNGQLIDGRLRYTFENRNDSINVHADHALMVVEWFYKATGKNTAKVVPVDNGSFSERYSNHEHSDGHFVVQIPYID